MYHIIISLSQRVRNVTCTLQLIRADLGRWCVRLQHESPATGCCMKLWWSMFVFQAAAARNLRLGQQKKQWNIMKHKINPKKSSYFRYAKGSSPRVQVSRLPSGRAPWHQPQWSRRWTPLASVWTYLDRSPWEANRSGRNQKLWGSHWPTSWKIRYPNAGPWHVENVWKCMKIKMSGSGKVNRWSRKPRITKTWLAPFKDFPGLHFFCKLLEQLWHPL